MKILFFVKRFYPDLGGVEKHVLKISEQFINKGHDVTIITEFTGALLPKKKSGYHSNSLTDIASLPLIKPVKSSYFEFYKVGRIKIYSFKFGNENFFKKFKIWLLLLLKIKLILDSDVVHCHDVFFWYMPFRFLLPAKKVFVTFHGYESYPLSYKNILIRKISELLAYGNICVGEFMRKWYWTHPDTVIYGATETESKIEGPVSRVRPSALFFGRLDEQTGILDYAKGVEEIKKKHPGFTFNVIGEGKYQKAVQKYKIASFMRNPEKKLTNYRFAFVSRYLSMLEAMAAGKLIFAVYNNPIKYDYLKMTPFSSWIEICGSAQELSQRLQFYLANPQLEEEKVEKARAWVEKQTWVKIVQVYEKLWSKD